MARGKRAGGRLGSRAHKNENDENSTKQNPTTPPPHHLITPIIPPLRHLTTLHSNLVATEFGFPSPASNLLAPMPYLYITVRAMTSSILKLESNSELGPNPQFKSAL